LLSRDGRTRWVDCGWSSAVCAAELYQFRTVVTDEAGNSATSNAITVTVDTSAPAAGTLALTNFADSGASGTDFVTQDKTFDLTRSEERRGGKEGSYGSTAGGKSKAT